MLRNTHSGTNKTEIYAVLPPSSRMKLASRKGLPWTNGHNERVFFHIHYIQFLSLFASYLTH